MDRYLTFIYIRRGNAGVRNIRIHRILAITVAVAFVTLLFTATLMIVKYSGYVRDARRVAELEGENERLATRIEGFQVEVEDLKRRMEVNFELQNRARVLASLEPITPDVWQVGIGGPEPSLSDPNLVNADLLFSGLENNLDRLVRQTELELQGYEEIIAILENDRMIRDATPSIRPLKGGFLSSRFGRRMDPFTGRLAYHEGVDYRARTGTPVICTADGVVTMAKKKGSFGLMIEVNHGNGFKTRFAHLSKMLVKRGKRVKRGEIIGLVGNTGRSTGSHLHYEVLFRKNRRDPLQYIIPSGIYYD